MKQTMLIVFGVSGLTIQRKELFQLTPRIQ